MTVKQQVKPQSNVEAIVSEGTTTAGATNTQTQPKTLYDKLFEDHVVCEIKKNDDNENEKSDTFLIYIDRHLVHEVTSPQAFEGLATSNRPVRYNTHTT